MSSGKLYPNLRSIEPKKNCDSKDKVKDKSKKKCDKCNMKKYAEIPIVAHESEKPSLLLEEICSGRLSHFVWCKIIETHIEVHDSEEPSIVFEEIGAGKLNSLIQTSITNYKDNIKKTKNLNQLKCGGKKKNQKSKDFKEIPIVSHESECPSFTFEQINAGKLFSNVQTSTTDYCKLKKLINHQKSEKKIETHKSEKPSAVFEEANTGIPLDITHQK